MINIIGKRFWYFIIAGIIVLICVVAMGASGLKFGIEFSSGSILTVSFKQPVNIPDIKQELAGAGFPGVIVQKTATNDYLIRLPELTKEQRTTIETALTTKFGEMEEREFNAISPMVATETAKNAAIGLAAAIVAILLYVVWAFRKMPRPFLYGACAVIALVHDVVVAAGVFAILGLVLSWEVDLMFITGILAVIGYSINNTIVVFDRIRENVTKGISPDFEVVVNRSVVDTLGRCLNTNFTTLITILALFLFVGSSIQSFVVVMMVGVIAGTYDSSFVAPSLLLTWQKGDWGRLIGRRSQQAAARSA